MALKFYDDRILVHCDVNGHFAYSELLYFPRLLTVPFVVGGGISVDSRSLDGSRNGIILSKNEAAKKYRIGTGNSLIQARRVCPHLVNHPPNYPLFTRTSNDFYGYGGQFSDKLAGFGCDGFTIDITGTAHLFGGVEAVVKMLHEEFPRRYGLHLSIGVSWNFTFSKLACDTAGANGVQYIMRESKDDTDWQKIVYPMDVGELLNVGEATRNKLWSKGERTIGDLVACGPEVLHNWFGKNGVALYVAASGQDNSPIVNSDGNPPIESMDSIGNGSTTPYDMVREEQVHNLGHVLSSSVCERMRRHRVVPRTVVVSVLYKQDGELKHASFQCPMKVPSNIDTEFADVALNLLEKRFNLRYPIRKMTVRAKNLMFNTSVYQTTLELNANLREHKMKILAVKDELNERYQYAVKRCVELADPLLTGLGSKPNQQFAPAGWY